MFLIIFEFECEFLLFFKFFVFLFIWILRFNGFFQFQQATEQPPQQRTWRLFIFSLYFFILILFWRFQNIWRGRKHNVKGETEWMSCDTNICLLAKNFEEISRKIHGIICEKVAIHMLNFNLLIKQMFPLRFGKKTSFIISVCVCSFFSAVLFFNYLWDFLFF